MANENPGVLRYLVSRRWFKVCLVTTIVLLACGYIILRWSTMPVSTTVVQTTPTQTQTTEAEYRELQTRYFSVQIPASWQTMSNNAKENEIRIVASAPGTLTGRIAFVSTVIPSDGLNGIGDYNLRTHDTRYTQLHDALLPADAVVFSNNQQIAYTAFLTKSDRYASVSVSDMTSQDEALKLLAHLLDTWQWLCKTKTTSANPNYCQL